MADIDRVGNKIFTNQVMKTTWCCILSAFLMAAVPATILGGSEAAVVKGDTVNVRGQPTIYSEVITQLKKGDKVVVLEEITHTKSKPDDPPKWSRIQMPANTPVWVATSFIDTNTSTVKPAKLNMRAGPGENYSVLGQLKRDQTVKTIQVRNSWIEIECPTNAYAFVASELLAPAPAVETPAPAEKPAEKPPEKPAEKPAEQPGVTNAPALPPTQPAPPPTEQSKPSTETPPPPVEQPKVATEPPSVEQPKLPTETPPPQVPPPAPLPTLTNEAPATPPSVSPGLVTPPPLAAPQPPSEKPAPPKRTVYREGIVRQVYSVQAPTYYELASADTGKTMNFLMPTSTNMVFKKYLFKRIYVSGQEFMDANWPSTPILKVETLKLAP